MDMAQFLELHKRVKMAEALPLIGKAERVAQQMAEAGEIPGAVKIRGEWTFNLRKLLGWIEDLERQQCASRKINDAAKPRPTRSGMVTSSTVASASRENSGAGRYERAMLRLAGNGLKKTSRG
jgi:hypothetical protein